MDGDAVGSGGFASEVELAPVMRLMTPGAQRDQIVRVSRPTVDPVPEMMGVEVHRPPTHDTPLVSLEDQASEVVGDDPDRSSEGEGCAGCVDHGLNGSVTTDQTEEFLGDGGAEMGPTGQTALGEVEVEQDF